MSPGIPISVIVVTKNEASRIEACLKALTRFDDVWVVDSNSDDDTVEIAQALGAHVENFTWNGQYPKKRQWCLETLDLKYDRVFFVVADEIVPADLVDEIAALDWEEAGYFVCGHYQFENKILKHGLRNNKLALLDRRKVEFPVVDDLDLPGMGEVEGHYQPVLKDGFEGEKIGQLQTAMIHEACESIAAWEARHMRYATWEAGMNAKDAWPKDPVLWRQALKVVFRKMPMRSVAAFVHSFVFKAGFLDGAWGMRFALLRARYYRMILDASKAQGHNGAVATTLLERS